jgi:hypothetical protein
MGQILNDRLYGIAKDEENVDRLLREVCKEYSKTAGQGDPVEQNHLGYMYRNGQGVTKNEAEAVKWYRRAAEQGNVDAKQDLKELL